MKTPKNKNTRQIIASLALIVGAVGVGAGASYAAAPSTDAPAETVAPGDAEVPADLEECTEISLSPGDVAPQSESDVEVSISADENYEAEWNALDPAEQASAIDEMKAFNDKLVAVLDEAGVSYELVNDPVTGVDFPEITGDASAADEALTELFEAEVAAGSAEEVSCVIETVEDDGSFEEMFNGLDQAEKTEWIEDMKAFNADVIAGFDAAGIEYTLETDPITGLEFPCPEGDEAAADQVFEDVIENHLDASFVTQGA